MKNAVLLALLACALHVPSLQAYRPSLGDFREELKRKIGDKRGMGAFRITARELRAVINENPARVKNYTMVAFKMARSPRGYVTQTGLLSYEILLKAVMDGYLESRGGPDLRLVQAISFFYKALPTSLKASRLTAPSLFAVMQASDLRHGGDTPERQALFERLMGRFRKIPGIIIDY